MPDPRRSLTVHLGRTKDTLERAYSLGNRTIHRSSVAWQTLGNSFRFADVEGLDAIARLLDGGDEHQLTASFTRSNLAEVGEILFATLFGGPEDWGPVFRAVFDQPDGPEPRPIFNAVRLRIATRDPALLGMPWRATSWQGKRLVAGLFPWTFEVAASETGRSAHLPVPPKILVIAPEVAEMDALGTAAHTAELREAAVSVSSRYNDPAYFRTVDNRDDLIAAVQGMQPHLVYYYGHAEVVGGQASLALTDASKRKRSLIMDDLANILKPPPVAVFLNGCMSGASGWHSAGYKLSPDVPMVISNRTTAWTGRSGPAAIRWIRDLLRGTDDPVALLDTIDAAEATQGFQWVTTLVHTAYDHWTSGTADEEAMPPIGLRLDRQHQRRAALGQVSDLTQGSLKRVEAMIAYGETGNHVDQACDQVVDYVETRGKQTARIKRLRLPFPGARDGLAARLESDLRTALKCRPGDVLEFALRNFLPRADATRPTPLLWIDWGTLGHGTQAPLTGAELSEWLEIGATLLAAACPKECRIVSFLSIVSAAGSQKRLASFVGTLRLSLTNDAFGFQLLPEFQGLEVIDIFEYLRDPRNTKCPPAWARDMAELLHRAAKGNYEATVALIQEGEAMTWTRLRARLESSVDPGPFNKDQPF